MDCTISIAVRVTDRRALRNAAEAVYVRQNKDPRNAVCPNDQRKALLADWRARRKAHNGGPVAADLMMIFDPGSSPPGTEILESTVE